MAKAKNAVKTIAAAILVFVLMASWVLISGCGKKPASENSQSQPAAGAGQTSSATPGGISQAGLDFGAAYRSCESNLKNVSTALEMYATDNQGHYPASLSQIVPAYLRSIPACPAAGKDTYSSSYTSSQNPDAYTFYCSGDNHKEVNAGENYPQYSSSQGLIQKQGGK
ncbi:MAG: hypothetical protein M1536_02770 [Firmicutes bacterium]|nr:hypothetical protein [Bacillota bacterium]